MILVDMSQVILSGIHANLGKEANRKNPNAKLFIKHIILNTLLSYKEKWGNEYGDIILAFDGRKYWRKEVFPYYKGQRKASREKSGLDWEFIFEVIDETKVDLRENFMYKMIEIPRAEADDVIACMVKHLQTNELKQTGIFNDSPQDILIVSSDGDFIQLQEYSGVKQWSPQTKKFVTPKTSVKEYKITHFCTASDDGIPNICSPDDVFMREDLRQTPFKKVRLPEFFEKGIDACKNDQERRNYQRNQLLIDFHMIPDDIYNSIISEYTTQVVTGSKMKILNYLVKNQMKLLVEHVGKF